MTLSKAAIPYVPPFTRATAIKTIPMGLRLVHNFEPGSAGRRTSEGGFRAWWEKADAKPRRRVCRCRWAPHLKRHYDADAWRQKGKRS